MKKIKYILTILLILITMLFALPIQAMASEPTDKILEYTIDITPRDDGTLDMKYHIKWEVLESDNAGALEWVKIGLPNQHFDEMTAISDNIDHINTTKGSSIYASIYFKDKYVKGDIVTFEFSFHQDYMYSMNKEKEGFTKFVFTPGWFDEIDIENLTINWHGKMAESVYPSCTYDNNCYTWEAFLPMGEKYPIELLYPNEAYDFDPEKDIENANNSEMGVEDWICIIITVVMIFLFIMALITEESNSNYSSGRGFGGSRSVFIHSSSSSSRSSCVRSSCVSSSCACACACACAGGGRAGCSTKDFYNTNLKLKQLEFKKNNKK